jgi:hypothetical protein
MHTDACGLRGAPDPGCLSLTSRPHHAGVTYAVPPVQRDRQPSFTPASARLAACTARRLTLRSSRSRSCHTVAATAAAADLARWELS